MSSSTPGIPKFAHLAVTGYAKPAQNRGNTVKAITNHKIWLELFCRGHTRLNIVDLRAHAEQTPRKAPTIQSSQCLYRRRLGRQARQHNHLCRRFAPDVHQALRRRLCPAHATSSRRSGQSKGASYSQFFLYIITSAADTNGSRWLRVFKWGQSESDLMPMFLTTEFIFVQQF